MRLFTNCKCKGAYGILWMVKRIEIGSNILEVHNIDGVHVVRMQNPCSTFLYVTAL